MRQPASETQSYARPEPTTHIEESCAAGTDCAKLAFVTRPLTYPTINGGTKNGLTSRRAFLRDSLGFAAAVGARPFGAAALGTAPDSKRRMIRWRAEEVAKVPGGYQVAVADVNGDGRLDILGLSGDKSIVEWYENPTWKVRPVTATTHKNISLAPLFRAGYAARGMALATEFALN